MIVRPFDWKDIPLLVRYRRQGVHLDAEAAVTRGSWVMPTALVSLISPPVGVFTCVVDGDVAEGTPLVGQFLHLPGAKYAHLTFLAPQDGLDSPHTTALLEYITMICGERGALRLLADADEKTMALEALRKAGFAIYSRQRVWRLDSLDETFVTLDMEEANQHQWRIATPREAPAIQALYSSVVPALVQQMESFEADKAHGLTLYTRGELSAYVELRYGYRGIWALPFFHPGVENPALYIASLWRDLPYRLSRPLYICVRSYQAWMEETMEALGAQPGAKQAVMARHLVVQSRAMRPVILPGLEGRQPEITAPIVNLEMEH